MEQREPISDCNSQLERGVALHRSESLNLFRDTLQPPLRQVAEPAKIGTAACTLSILTRRGKVLLHSTNGKNSAKSTLICNNSGITICRRSCQSTWACVAEKIRSVPTLAPVSADGAARFLAIFGSWNGRVDGLMAMHWQIQPESFSADEQPAIRES